MRKSVPLSLAGFCRAGAVLVLGLLLSWTPRSMGAPYTDHFEDLIADLHTREASLSNSTDKVQAKQFKTVVKVLVSLEIKTSTSLATDIKNLGSTAKSLVTSFPTEFNSPGGSLSTNLEAALTGLVSDVQNKIDTTQTALNGQADSSCKTKAQTTLDAASNLVAQATAAPDFVTASKLLASALKSQAKADAAAAKCTATSGGGGGGGGGGDFMTASITGDFSLNFVGQGKPPVTASYVSTLPFTTFNIVAGDAALGGVGMDVTAINVTGPGTYPVFAGSNVSRVKPASSYALGDGTITFTTFDLAQQKASGTFSFTATQLVPPTSATVTITNGTFSVTKITEQ